MKTQHPTAVPVDPASLRGMVSHAETHWLTFATAMKCYAKRPSKPALRTAAERHGPTWLRRALKQGHAPDRPVQRPPEFEPLTGSLAYLTRGAEDALVPPSTQGNLRSGEGRRPSLGSQAKHARILAEHAPTSTDDPRSR